MFDQLTDSDRTVAIQRLTALWAFNECGLGGILHAINSPFTGLLVGGIAMISIAFIASLARDKWGAVMTSLVVVLVIKGLVSPHTSPTAYIAVTFQAVTGALIYRYIPGLLIGSLLFVTLGQMESAAQRLLTLTILYGNTLWEAVNIWGDWVFDKWNIILPFSSARLVIYIYLLIHFIAGLLIGWMVYRIIRAAHRHWGDARYQLVLDQGDKRSLFDHRKHPRRKWKRYLFLVVVMIMIVLAYLINPASNDVMKGLIAVARSLLLLAVWFVFLGPLVMKVIQKYLAKKHGYLSQQVDHTMDMMPHLAWIIEKAWRESGEVQKTGKWKAFILTALLYILQFRIHDDTHTHRPDTQP
jgi:hypothetical protein